MSFGDMQIQDGDKVIVFCLPEAISTVEGLFN
jgi:trk system potassium uptake protein TrkA